MRDYGKVYTAFWTSEDARDLSEDGRMLALYLMTCPHGNMLGCFRLSDAYAADDLQWGIERVREGFNELYGKGFAYRCDKTFYVLIRYFLKWNQFENPNVGKAASKMFKLLNAPHNVKAALALALRDFAPHFPTVELNAFIASMEPFENPFDLSSKTRTKPEPEPKPEPQPKTLVALTADRAGQDIKAEKKGAIIARIFVYWQDVMGSPRSKLDSDRQGWIEKALKNYRPEEICEAIRGCAMTEHNMGINDRKTKFNGLHIILKNADNIDRFIRKARENPNGKPLGQPETEDEYLASVQASLDRLNGHAPAEADDPNIIDMEQADAQQ